MGTQLLFGAKAPAGDPVGFSKLLSNLAKTITDWGDNILILVGIVLIVYGCVAMFKAIKSMSGQQGGGGGMEWAKAILAIIIGIVLTAAKVGDIRHNSAIDNNTLKHALNGEG